MRQAWFALALVVASSTVSRAGDAEQRPDYYPMAVGDRWAYEAMIDGQRLDLTSEIKKIEKIDDQPLAVLHSDISGSQTVEHLSSSDKGIFRHRYNGLEISPPACLLKYPVRPGDTWEETIKYGDQSYKIEGRVEKFEEVEVPAGKFTAAKVSIKTLDGDNSVESIYWFADGVGYVQQQMNMPNSDRMVKLLKFEPAK